MRLKRSEGIEAYISTQSTTFHNIPHPKDNLAESYSRRIAPSKKRANYTARNRSLIIKRYGTFWQKLIHFSIFFIPINGYVILNAIIFRKWDYIPEILKGMLTVIKM